MNKTGMFELGIYLHWSGVNKSDIKLLVNTISSFVVSKSDLLFVSSEEKIQKKKALKF